ncbi:hypothetical protein AP057_09910 [Geobacillus sp. Sah69]|nr:hypothetical protein AP057_09910 [Geobacillus sp. Sah69]
MFLKIRILYFGKLVKSLGQPFVGMDALSRFILVILVGGMMKKNLSAISLIHFLKKLNMKTLSSSWAILITTPTFVERAMIT